MSLIEELKGSSRPEPAAAFSEHPAVVNENWPSAAQLNYMVLLARQEGEGISAEALVDRQAASDLITRLKEGKNRYGAV